MCSSITKIISFFFRLRRSDRIHRSTGIAMACVIVYRYRYFVLSIDWHHKLSALRPEPALCFVTKLTKMADRPGPTSQFPLPNSKHSIKYSSVSNSTISIQSIYCSSWCNTMIITLDWKLFRVQDYCKEIWLQKIRFVWLAQHSNVFRCGTRSRNVSVDTRW